MYVVCNCLLSSCHIYKSYDRPEDIEISGLYRDTVAGGDTLVSDTTNFGNLPWREVFSILSYKHSLSRDWRIIPICRPPY